MKQIAIVLPKEAYLHGEFVKGEVKLLIDKPVKARAVKLFASGLEETHITERHHDHRHTYRERNYIMRNEIILHGPQYSENLELNPGNYIFEFDFKVPENALPSFTGTYSSVSYELNAKVDVPFWLDILDRRPIYIFRRRDALDLLKRPVSFCSDNYSDPYDKKPGFSVELTKTGYIAGEVIEGTIVLKNMAASKLRKIYVKLLGEEFARANGNKRTRIHHTEKIEISVDDMVEGIPKLFFLSTPRDAPSSYEGMFSNFRWGVEVGLDIPLGFDIKALHPVEILR